MVIWTSMCTCYRTGAKSNGGLKQVLHLHVFMGAMAPFAIEWKSRGCIGILGHSNRDEINRLGGLVR